MIAHPFIDTWLPVVYHYDDLFIPATAAPLLRALIGLDDESATMSVKLWAMEAERGMEERRN